MRRGLLAIAVLAAIAFLAISLHIRAVGGAAGVAASERPVEVSPSLAPSAAAARRELTGSPPALAALHRQGGRLLTSGSLAARLERLRRYPVVLDAWASWCPPCREELPLLAAAAARYGRRVAFLGADVEDQAGAARSFLAAHPLSYPSYPSDSGSLGEIAPLHGTPTTIFLARGGALAGQRIGAYRSLAELEADISRYALGRGGHP